MNSKKLEVLCVTMHQTDFSKISKMNIKSDVIFANQTDKTAYDEFIFDGEHTAKMISTVTRGVGKNRNNAFLYASGDILLLSDDDMVYTDTYCDDIISEFNAHPDADVIIFNITTTDELRKQKQNLKTKKIGYFARLPYGAPRVAIRRTSWEKSNVWFSLLFGGGAKYSNGEDSIFINDLRNSGLNIFVSKYVIGTVDMTNSSWYAGANETYYRNKGSLSYVMHKHTYHLWWLYHALRVKSDIPFFERLKQEKSGFQSFKSYK